MRLRTVRAHTDCCARHNGSSREVLFRLAQSLENNVSDAQCDELQALRAKLIAARQALPDRLERAVHLQNVLRVWLATQREKAIGAYWPIKGEFDPLPALYRWSEGAPGRQIGLPVVDKSSGCLRFHVWFPGCPTELDAYDIPKPKGTPEFAPDMLLLPCVGYGPEGVRLGYGGGFYDRTVAEVQPRPRVVGLSYANAFLPLLRAQPGSIALDALITDDGVSWQREDGAQQRRW